MAFRDHSGARSTSGGTAVGRFDRVASGVRRAVVLLAAIGCAGSLGPQEELREDLERARQQWDASRPATYVYVIERLCFCLDEWRGPARVTVVGVDPTERVYVDTGDPVPAQAEDAFPSVDGLFAIIEDALDEDAHSVEVIYDQSTGVPLEIRIDYIELAIDEELGFDVVEQPAGA
jgi:hypothetical protein